MTAKKSIKRMKGEIGGEKKKRKRKRVLLRNLVLNWEVPDAEMSLVLMIIWACKC